MTDTIGGRFKTLVDYLKETPLSFARAIGYDRSEKITRIIRGENGPSWEMLRDISKAYPKISLDWLITGKGEIIKNESSSTGGVIHVKQDSSTALVPLVDRYAQKSYSNNYDRLSFISALPIVEEEAYNDYVYRDFEVGDDRNSPKFIDGDILRSKFIDLKDVVKKVDPSFFDDKTIILVIDGGVKIGSITISLKGVEISYINPMYKPEIIQLDQIREAWIYHELRTRRN